MNARIVVLGLLLAAGGAGLHAHQAAAAPSQAPAARPDQPPGGAAREGYVPIDQLPPPQDRVPAPALVGTAYAFVWVALFVYVWSIWRRLGTVERELDAVSRRIGSGPRAS